MRCINCKKDIGSQERIMLQVKGPTYCMRCTPRSVGNNGREVLREARKLIGEDGAESVSMTIRKYKNRLVYELRRRR